MKNNQKGFIIPLLVSIIALLVIGGSIYIYKTISTSSPSGVSVDSALSNQTNQPVTNNSTGSTNNSSKKIAAGMKEAGS